MGQVVWVVESELAPKHAGAYFSAFHKAGEKGKERGARVTEGERESELWESRTCGVLGTGERYSPLPPRVTVRRKCSRYIYQSTHILLTCPIISPSVSLDT